MRTTQQILADMDTVQATIPEASVLTSKSKTAVFGLLRTLWALFVQSLEKFIEQTQADLAAYVATAQIGSLSWYVAQVKAFQFTDTLTVIGGRPGYAVIDPAKQVVTQCAVVETDGRLLIKTAKNKDFFEKQALSSSELQAVQEYVRQIKYAGVAADVISLPPDELRILATVKYNRQLVGPNGEMLNNTGRIPALEAIIKYVQSLPFNSVLNWTALTDYAQAYEGVDDFLIARTFIRPAGGTEWVEFTRETTSRAGHVKLIDGNITYV